MKKYIIGIIVVIIILGAIVFYMKYIDRDSSIFNYWTDNEGVYMGDVIPDEESAIAIATAIYNSIPQNGKQKEYVVQGVMYDTKVEVWIVTFGENNSKVAGGDCSIVLQKKDGKVVKIWFGEQRCDTGDGSLC